MTLAVGSKVKLRDDGIEWLEAKTRLRAGRGIVAVVTGVIGTALREDRRSYHLRFEATGRMKEYVPSHGFNYRDLIEIE